LALRGAYALVEAKTEGVRAIGKMAEEPKLSACMRQYLCLTGNIIECSVFCQSRKRVRRENMAEQQAAAVTEMEGLAVEGGEMSKAQLKKQAAKELKEAQKAEKAAKAAAADQARAAAVEDDALAHLYGDMPLVQSQEQTGRVRTRLGLARDPGSHAAGPGREW
jgi:hypothetical protein